MYPLNPPVRRSMKRTAVCPPNSDASSVASQLAQAITLLLTELATTFNTAPMMQEMPLTHVLQPTASPNPMANGTVDKRRPQDEEDHVRAELHPLREGARNQRRGDDGEHPLIRREE